MSSSQLVQKHSTGIVSSNQHHQWYHWGAKSGEVALTVCAEQDCLAIGSPPSAPQANDCEKEGRTLR